MVPEMELSPVSLVQALAGKVFPKVVLIKRK
jgi:hypothetical protein